VSVSRGISDKATLGPGAMGAEARRLRDQINVCRNRKLPATAVVDVLISGSVANLASPAPLKDYQRHFLSFAVARGALQFGSYTLKSGRVSPYFFNAGTLSSGASLNALGRYGLSSVTASECTGDSGAARFYTDSTRKRFATPA
jgi:hypothetical protein